MLVNGLEEKGTATRKSGKLQRSRLELPGPRTGLEMINETVVFKEPSGKMERC